MPNPDPPPPKSKVTRLPTELTDLFERVLASHDAAGTLLRPAEQVDPHDQVSTTVDSDDHRAVGASTGELDLRRAVSPDDAASNMGARTSSAEPLVQDLVDKIRGEEILEAVIGLGLLLVGIAVFVALALLPHKPGMWLFIAAAVVLMFAGGRRIDAATRAHRRAKHSKSRRAQ